MATAKEVQNRAASDLGVLRLGQAMAPNDAVRLSAAYNEIYTQLESKALTTSWVNGDTVPDDIVPHVVALIAQSCLGTYGVSNDRYTRIVNAASIADREIRFFMTPSYTGDNDGDGSVDEVQDF